MRLASHDSNLNTKRVVLLVTTFVFKVAYLGFAHKSTVKLGRHAKSDAPTGLHDSIPGFAQLSPVQAPIFGVSVGHSLTHSTHS